MLGEKTPSKWLCITASLCPIFFIYRGEFFFLERVENQTRLEKTYNKLNAGERRVLRAFSKIRTKLRGG